MEARGLASGAFAELKSGASTDLHLIYGATVTGQVLKDGKPLPNITLGLVQSDKEVETFLGPMTIGTDAQGRFQFLNVAPRLEYCVYGIMQKMNGRGAIVSRKITLGDDNSTFDTGKVIVDRAHSIQGRVALADGKKTPAGTKLFVDRDGAWDSQFIDIDSQGKFTATGLPGEPLHLSIFIPGYVLSPKNIGFAAAGPDWLTITPTDSEQDIQIEMEPKK